MATKTEWFLRVGVPLLAHVPDGVFFDTKEKGLEFQATTLKDVRAIRSAFPGLIWKKTWEEDLSWWEYHTTTVDGSTLRIYAVREGPRQCKAVFETQVVEERIPIAFETRTVEKQVLIGWDCGADEGGE